jgi:hypothetical protein
MRTRVSTGSRKVVGRSMPTFGIRPLAAGLAAEWRIASSNRRRIGYARCGVLRITPF